jgi:hypothetical protein
MFNSPNAVQLLEDIIQEDVERETDFRRIGGH